MLTPSCRLQDGSLELLIVATNHDFQTDSYLPAKVFFPDEYESFLMEIEDPSGEYLDFLNERKEQLSTIPDDKGFILFLEYAIHNNGTEYNNFGGYFEHISENVVDENLDLVHHVLNQPKYLRNVPVDFLMRYSTILPLDTHIAFMNIMSQTGSDRLDEYGNLIQ